MFIHVCNILIMFLWMNLKIGLKLSHQIECFFVYVLTCLTIACPTTCFTFFFFLFFVLYCSLCCSCGIVACNIRSNPLISAQSGKGCPKHSRKTFYKRREKFHSRGEEVCDLPGPSDCDTDSDIDTVASGSPTCQSIKNKQKSKGRGKQSVDQHEKNQAVNAIKQQ